MNDHKKPVSGVEVTANPTPSQGRRRFFKTAALTAPAVMTLCSGRLAMAASLCTENTGSTVDTTGMPILTKDYQSYNFYYYDTVYGVQEYKKKISYRTYAYYYTDDGSTFYDATGFPVTAPSGLTYVKKIQAYRLRQPEGQDVAFTKSCWASFNPKT